jgi:hypothetical protein
VEYVPFREKNQKELQYRRESTVDTGFSPDYEMKFFIERIRFAVPPWSGMVSLHGSL